MCIECRTQKFQSYLTEHRYEGSAHAGNRLIFPYSDLEKFKLDTQHFVLEKKAKQTLSQFLFTGNALYVVRMSLN